MLNIGPHSSRQFLPIMEVFKYQIPTLVFLNSPELLKGLWGSDSLASQGYCSPILVTPHTQQEIIINVWVMFLAGAKNMFLLLTEEWGGPLSISL